MDAYNELRAAQAQATRARILEATVAVMARGVASVSIPAVAREAGVSVPTVYRHFATKRDLLTSVFPHVLHRFRDQSQSNTFTSCALIHSNRSN